MSVKCCPTYPVETEYLIDIASCVLRGQTHTQGAFYLEVMNISEYIDKVNALSYLKEKYNEMNGMSAWYYAGFQHAVGLLENFQKSDVAPIAHGKWGHAHTSESYFNECWRCSVCGFDDTEGFGFKFCPICGAKMDLE